ncbi:hypothetical protein GCM10012283_00960 [Phycicoccus endophyticus]|nr:hypothetical protein GCM10012283_00960 [Phycicoccus endophyticus]
MAHRHDDPLVVTTHAPSPTGGRDGTPRTFVWRGRRHTVCAVLDTWQERRPWWRAVGQGDAPSTAGAHPATERRVWRVEARPPVGPVGVFDLARDDDHWLLLRAHD